MNTRIQPLQRLPILGALARHPIFPVAILVWTVWLIGMTAGGHWPLFADRFYMSITMLFGSFVAGATSEGGGAVAFPVMTLVFGISPQVARDFSLIIQSVGMTAAAIAIFRMGVPVARAPIIYSGLGGVAGIVTSLSLLDGVIPPAYVKIFFVSLWLAFGAALWWINRDRERAVMSAPPDTALVRLLLVGVGFIGGMVSGVLGNGIDVLVFAVLVLGFRVSEAIATPTSVILMAGNALAGALWKGLAGPGLLPEAWAYWWVCVPIVVLGAPFGAWFIRRHSRQFIARLLIFFIVVQYVAAILIIPQSPSLVAFSVAVTVAGVAAFALLSRIGRRRPSPRQARAASRKQTWLEPSMETS